ncbi:MULTISPECIES: hypothetical protein [unclassified Nocardioides]|uniref:hypothetical protein n=1 Tax=unclassified Nocardioides TaxID=2615069 RepID=UPI0009F042FF|nr:MULTISPECIES: hypothetical protein [unclassified Nocardioides]GAW47927.1 uncharacterized protein (Precursor) [Nocardioides sp. PD653-B2]GAW53770.1 uncharacterized protein (Precursor) [Nocardioides sp. PD653]
MQASTKVLRLIAVMPAGVAGSFIAVIGLGFLPGAGLVLAFLGTVATFLVLALGALEGPAARLFGFSRGPRPGEKAVLEPALRLVEKLDLAPERVLVRLVDSDDLLVVPIGRVTVIVEPWLLEGLFERRLTVADAATAIGHAVASQRVGPSRFDLATRLWAFPWALVHVIVRQIARAFSWVPAAGLAWHLRIVVGVVAVFQGFQPGGSPTLGVATGALVAVSYIAPAADRCWRAVVEREADRVVSSRGLADPLIQFVQWRLSARSMERVHRIRTAAAGATTSSASGAELIDEPARGPVLAHAVAIR